MKLNKYTLLIAGGMLLFSSCNDFLDREPLDRITPDNFLMTASDLNSYALGFYDGAFSIGGMGLASDDNNSDNQASSSYSNQWTPGQWRVSESEVKDSENWHFTKIYNCNYFLGKVVPRYEAGVYTDNIAGAKHAIGEGYFFRAWDYFKRLKMFGDLPIIREIIPDKEDVLIEASRRQPRNKVVRFILEDLDKAAGLLSDTPDGGSNRVTKKLAYLLKSRVALYEASWETYHKGTNRVPGGPGWPGNASDLGEGFSIDTEIAFFLSECKKSAEQVADNVALATNTHIREEGKRKMDNPYYAQFATESQKNYPEILLWKDYSLELQVLHSIGYHFRRGGSTGLTRQFLETFLMKNGRPIYASNGDYRGDLTVQDLIVNRDERLGLFMIMPDELLSEDTGQKEAPNPDILNEYNLPNLFDVSDNRSITGYQMRKGLPNYWSRTGGVNAEGVPLFRAAEAYLNYLEASCIENSGNSIDAKAANYWKLLRERAGLPADYMVTVNATDLNKENDWAVFSGSEMVTPLLYSIRRERRCELMEEGFRMNDLKRWRSLDQVKAIKKWQPEGINLWADGGYAQKYTDAKDKDGHAPYVIIADGSSKANVSPKSKGNYLRPYEITNSSSNLMWDKGYEWCDAHYLYPIATTHLRIASSNPSDLLTSTIYQNPGWPTEAGKGPIGY